MLTGLSDVGGNGIIAGSSTGQAEWVIVPTVDAAPVTNTEYFVGGTLTYQQDGQSITVPLTPTSVTVFPMAQLNLKYFLERDVFADDPFTPQIEPSIPFNLAVMVENNGAGVARNMSIVSAQPKIVENESGLLIDFKIIATDQGERQLVGGLGWGLWTKGGSTGWSA